MLAQPIWLECLPRVPEAIWNGRYPQINDFEHLLYESGTRVVKLLLYISRAEQKRRFEERLKERAKQWKFDPADLRKRAPWYVIPAHRKWLRELLVSQILVQELEQLPLRWPKPDFDPAKMRVPV